ncbi:histone-lysine N-methyltransferase SETMAR-like [Stegodyphus dumicola]|uniref:histone-lysine N-methyltransferase SETMAR-like n=1 Tax=Stegodyphus dumicola TaxID=202533 RepID=UPI0015B1E7BA|nr:histone-lysine N-methyltransferase SETMAR-like [Stegodyphus dumicola]
MGGLFSQQLERVHQALMHQGHWSIVRVYATSLTMRDRMWLQRSGTPSSDWTGRHYHHHIPSTILPKPRANRFNNRPDLEKALTNFFASKALEFYRDGIAQLATRWQKAQDADGNYFED